MTELMPEWIEMVKIIELSLRQFLGGPNRTSVPIVMGKIIEGD
jgi:hypothetical protein